MRFVCASCRSETEALDSCDECGDDARLDERFRLERLLGRGASGITYRASRIQDDQVVCIKELSYSAMNSFEMKELFEREARVLRQLDHPGIPEYFDSFSHESDKNLSLYLVQEFIDGTTLEAEMEDHRYTELEILEILEELSGILTYLQQLRPPVFHRDIKPSNVMRNQDGRLVLVDFGSVRATTEGAVGGSTVAGTFGYMAPEQMWGRAEPQTDLYGLGALGLALLSRREPKSFVGSDQRLHWQDQVEASRPLGALFEELLAHDLQDRPADAEAARARIRETQRAIESPADHEGPAPSRSAHSPAAESEARSESFEPSAGSEPPSTPESDSNLAPTSATYGSKASDSKSHAAWWVAIVLIGFGFCGVVGAYVTFDGEPATTAGVPIGPNTCNETECRSLRLASIEPFEFGASPDAMRDADLQLTRVSADDTSEQTVYRTERVIGGERATCRLHFETADGGLQKFQCEMGIDDSIDRQREVTRTLLRKLMGRYGRPAIRVHPEGREDEEPNLDLEFRGRWKWSDAHGSLELGSNFKKSLFEQTMEQANDDSENPLSMLGDDDKPGGSIVLTHSRE